MYDEINLFHLLNYEIIIIIQGKIFFEIPLLKCIKLQVSNVFSVKLSSFFSLKNVTNVYILEKSSIMKLNVFHLDKV